MLLYQDLAGVETKSLREGEGENKNKAFFTGIASTADKDLTDDIIEAGAFGEVDPTRIALLRDHHQGQVIGKWLNFEQKGKRLEVEGEIGLDIGEKALETYKLMKHGYIKGLSVGFRPKKGGVTWDKDSDIRYIKSATLLEISVVSVPANQGARLHSVKSLSADSTRQWLYEGGLDDDEADIVMTRGFDALLKARRINITEIDGYREHNDAAFTALANEAKRFAELLR